jgi:hypothetical protein
MSIRFTFLIAISAGLISTRGFGQERPLPGQFINIGPIPLSKAQSGCVMDRAGESEETDWECAVARFDSLSKDNGLCNEKLDCCSTKKGSTREVIYQNGIECMERL